MAETSGVGMRRGGRMGLAAAAAVVAVTTVGGASAQDDAKPYEGQTLRIMVDALRENWDAKYWTQPFQDLTGATIEWTYVPFEGLDDGGDRRP